MKWVRSTIVLLAFVLFAGNFANAQSAADEPTWLLVLQGEVTGVSEQQLVLRASPRALLFTDRPARQVRFADAASFVDKAWGPGGDFEQDPPNAALVGESDGSIGIIEIEDASWEGAELTLSAILLEGAWPEVGDQVALTIDHFVICSDGVCHKF